MGFSFEKVVLLAKNQLSQVLVHFTYHTRSRQDRRILFLSDQRICYGAVRPIRSLEMTMEYAGVSVILQK